MFCVVHALLVCVCVCVCLVFFVALDGIPSSCMCPSLIGHFIQNKNFPRNARVAFLSLCLQMPRQWNNHRSMVDMVLILGDAFFQTCLNQHTLATVHETNMPCRP